MRNGLILSLGMVVLTAVCLASGGCTAEPSAKDVLADGEKAFTAQEYDQAIIDANKSINADATSPEAFYLRGRAIEERVKPDQTAVPHDLQMAQSDYNIALTLHPSPALAARIHAQLGNVDFTNGDFAAALKEWTVALPGLDTASKARAMYLMGLSQQRIGRFADADRTFDQVMQKFPGTESAREAMAHKGTKGFCVQVGAYDKMEDADKAAAAITAAGGIPQRLTDDKGRTIVRSSPVVDLQDAQKLRQKLLLNYPDAMILP